MILVQAHKGEDRDTFGQSLMEARTAFSVPWSWETLSFKGVLGTICDDVISDVE